MSSLAAARADNFYHPPDWDPNKEGLNKYQSRTGKGNAKYTGHNQYAKWGVIRFEMPFNIWCDGCGCMIAKGVRFNAKKNKVGNYFSTTIWEFEMPCHECFNKICVKTDPKSAEFLVTKGARRKVEEYSAKSAGTIELKSLEEREKIRSDAMASLEVGQEDKRKAKEQKSRLQQLADLSDRMKDDYAVSSLLRKRFRKRKNQEIADEYEQHRPGISLRILPATQRDKQEAALVRFAREARCSNGRAAKRYRIKSSMFDSSSVSELKPTLETATTTRSGASNESAAQAKAAHASSSSSSSSVISGSGKSRNSVSTGSSSSLNAVERALRQGIDASKLRLIPSNKQQQQLNQSTQQQQHRKAEQSLLPIRVKIREREKTEQVWAELLPENHSMHKQTNKLLTKIPLVKPITVIGRCPQAGTGFKVPCKYISARHVAIHRNISRSEHEESKINKHKQPTIIDKSSNGTWIVRRGKTSKLAKNRIVGLRDGDVVILHHDNDPERLVSYRFRLCLVGDSDDEHCGSNSAEGTENRKEKVEDRGSSSSSSKKPKKKKSGLLIRTMMRA